MMLSKSDPDEIQSFVSDASYMPGGFASRVIFPESAAEVAEVLASATHEGTPVTVSGAGTGTVAGRVPFGGYVLATDRLNKIKSIVREEAGGRTVVEAGVVLADLQRLLEPEALLYPPDPTERSCFLGGNVATNASGARTFKYGPTRNYVERLRIVLATGDLVDLRRRELRADASGRIEIPLQSGRTIEARLPSYRMPQVRKHASGYYVAPGMDLLDLFIGSEGTLGVIVEAEVKLLPKPEGLIAGIVFFKDQYELLAFVRETRNLSLQNRAKQARAGKTALSALESRLEDVWPLVPSSAVGAIFFEQEVSAKTEEDLLTTWYEYLQAHGALLDDSWFATNEQDQAKLREFRHQLPVLMNEWFARYKKQKVSTDMAVPDDEFAGMLRFYEETLLASDLRYTIFGHIGDNHVHVNILPRNDTEATKARRVYMQLVRQAVKVGGTISAEHGIGKLKREYLREMYTQEHLREMAALKRSFDPAGILGRGNIFSEDLLS
ncbi:MAG: FAD-binding oxidoreductase [Acidobacteria bacterium]|nr:FAD-binding oxidoreductase [Acidobacteriota bacterium]